MLLDCLESRYAVLNWCGYMVLDEADRMIDMGFEPQVIGVLDEMLPSHLKPENVERLACSGRPTCSAPHVQRHIQDDPHVQRHHAAARGAARQEVPPEPSGRHGRLRRQGGRPRCPERGHREGAREDATADEDPRRPRQGQKDDHCVLQHEEFRGEVDQRFGIRRVEQGDGLTALHGGESQDERKASLDGFRNDRFNVLVATDLPARGIDVPEVAHVINYEIPSSIDLYTHRIGRTGRAGKKGLSKSFLTMEDTDIFYELKQMLVQSNSPVSPELARHEASRFKPESVPGRPPRRNGTVHAYH
ncbi:hypothetical protein ZWY2020_003176 [Hordeum vulgare]|nr:hypothetical protein ZWY2020_003176 [Hordeum vulgare]